MSESEEIKKAIQNDPHPNHSLCRALDEAKAKESGRARDKPYDEKVEHGVGVQGPR